MCMRLRSRESFSRSPNRPDSADGLLCGALAPLAPLAPSEAWGIYLLPSAVRRLRSLVGDCFVAALLAMTPVVTLRAECMFCLPRLPRAKRGESTSCRLRSTVCGPLSGIASRLVAARSDIW